MVVGGSVNVREYHSLKLVLTNGLFMTWPFACTCLSPVAILSTAKVTLFIPANGTYNAGVKYADHSVQLVWT